MLANCVYSVAVYRNIHKQLACYAVLMDSWYATRAVMLFIEQLKVYYCPLKDNRQNERFIGSNMICCRITCVNN